MTVVNKQKNKILIRVFKLINNYQILKKSKLLKFKISTKFCKLNNSKKINKIKLIESSNFNNKLKPYKIIKMQLNNFKIIKTNKIQSEMK